MIGQNYMTHCAPAKSGAGEYRVPQIELVAKNIWRISNTHCHHIGSIFLGRRYLFLKAHCFPWATLSDLWGRFYWWISSSFFLFNNQWPSTTTRITPPSFYLSLKVFIPLSNFSQREEIKLFLGDYKLTSYITTTIRPNTNIQKLKVWQLRNDHVRTLQQTKGLQTWTE